MIYAGIGLYLSGFLITYFVLDPFLTGYREAKGKAFSFLVLLTLPFHEFHRFGLSVFWPAAIVVSLALDVGMLAIAILCAIGTPFYFLAKGIYFLFDRARSRESDPITKYFTNKGQIMAGTGEKE